MANLILNYDLVFDRSQNKMKLNSFQEMPHFYHKYFILIYSHISILFSCLSFLYLFIY